LFVEKQLSAPPTLAIPEATDENASLEFGGSMPAEAITETTILRVADKVSLQPLGEGEGGVILRLDTGELFTVNDTALAFVSSLDGSRSVASAVELVAEDYDVDSQTLARDVIEVASELLTANLVERVK
jgi:Coenzyme PQQ synthesis protein D (PqqD)